jgi:mono/diheme cytochrome c family protein
MRLSKKTLILSAAFSLSLGLISFPSYADSPYIVTNGNELDASSYNGFKLYRNWCARCHGTYGQGMVGPNLADSLKVIGKDQFFDTVAEGKTGSIGSMPAWKSNPEVMEGRDHIYAYLKARSDGAIGEIKPKKAK